MLVQVAHLCFVQNLDEVVHALGCEAWPSFEVNDINGPSPHGCGGESHGGVIKLDELISVLAFVDAIGKEGRHFDLVFDAGVIWDGAIGAIVGEGDVTRVGTQSSSTSNDGFAVVSDITANGVEVDFAAGVTEGGHRDKVVGD